MVNFYNVDCMQFMQDKPNKYYDLAIVDPPYGIGVSGQKEKIKNKKSDRKYHEEKFWDKDIPPKKYFYDLFRISKNQIIWGGNYFVDHLTKSSKGWIVWDKLQHGLTMSDCELAFSSFDTPTRIWQKNRCILKKEYTIHPTQKPVKLYEWLLTNYAKEGDKILDTHGGSGSSAIACQNLGYDLDICELDEDYFKAMTKRFKQETKQLDLFR